MTNNHSIGGFNNRKQLEVAVDAAEKMVGSATMSMDKDLIQSAEHAIADARQLFNEYSNDYDEAFLEEQQQKLTRCEHQLQEAKR
ncbi:DUF2564 family protein [Bacillus kexueae]|uniref:DUF2564 family protein n=1 Tax=Aeribacillus kexueae TaxID=2078952 RepID=UPI001FAE7EB6